MKCPKCSNELKTIEKKGIEVDYCENCKGVWFDLNELEDLSNNVKEFDFVAPRLEYLKIQETIEKDKKCPRCSAKMYKVTMNNKPPMFDCCPNNHGYWFDAKELEEYVRNNLITSKKPSINLLKKIVKQ